MKKRIIATIMAGLLVFSLAGCGSSSTETEEAEADTSAEEEIVEEIEEVTGEGKRVAGIWMTFDESVWKMHSDVLGEKLEELGYEYDAYDSANDSVTQISQVENAVVQGYDCIVIMPVLGEAVADVCQQAMDAGVPVVSFINDSVNHTIYRTTDAEYSGQMQAEYAVEWALDHFPDAEDGSINVALLGEDNDSHNVARWEKIQEVVASYPQMNIVSAVTTEESVEDGQAKAENIITQNPDKLINLWIVMGTAPMVGVNSAIMSESNGYTDAELSDICLCGTAIDDEMAEVMRASLTNESVYRVATGNGANLDLNLSELADCVDKLLKGLDYEEFSPVNVDMITPDNLADFGY